MKSGSKGLVELDLETGAMGGGAEKDKVGEDVPSEAALSQTVGCTLSCNQTILTQKGRTIKPCGPTQRAEVRCLWVTRFIGALFQKVWASLITNTWTMRVPKAMLNKALSYPLSVRQTPGLSGPWNRSWIERA